MTIVEALRAAAHYVEEHKATSAWNGPEMPSDEEKARVAAEVSALGHELDSLAAASETSRVYIREYEAVRSELQRIGLFLSPEIAQAVTEAFRAAAPSEAAPSRRPSVRVRGVAS